VSCVIDTVVYLYLMKRIPFGEQVFRMLLPQQPASNMYLCQMKQLNILS